MEKNASSSVKERFAGRKEEKRLFSAYLNAVVSGKSVGVAIIGPPGIGKSALMNEYAKMAEDAKTTVIGMTVGKNESEPELAGRIMLEAERMFGIGFGSSGDIADVLSKIKKHLPEEHNGMMLFLDDADNLKKMGDAMEKLKSLLRNETSVGIVLASTNPIKKPEEFRIMELYGIDEDEIRKMMENENEKERAKLGDEFLKMLIKDSNGNPGIIRIICDLLYGKLRKEEKMISKGHYLVNMPLIMSILSKDFFDRIYLETPNAEREILRKICESEGQVHLSDISKKLNKKAGEIATLATRLVARGAIVRIERGAYIPFARIFSRYVLERG